MIPEDLFIEFQVYMKMFRFLKMENSSLKIIKMIIIKI